MIMSSAYATVMGILPALITPETAVISDQLNPHCIINASRLARPGEKHVYKHLDMDELEGALAAAAKTMRRAIIVTDGIFSMRGDHAPLAYIMGLAQSFDQHFAENVLMVRDADETAALAEYLKDHGILATAIGYPVVPTGAEEIRFQISADHTEADVDEVLGVLAAYGKAA